MLGAFGLIDSDRIDRTVMDNTLQLVEECWKYPTLWGWDFADVYKRQLYNNSER